MKISVDVKVTNPAKPKALLIKLTCGDIIYFKNRVGRLFYVRAYDNFMTNSKFSTFVEVENFYSSENINYIPEDEKLTVTLEI